MKHIPTVGAYSFGFVDRRCATDDVQTTAYAATHTEAPGTSEEVTESFT